MERREGQYTAVEVKPPRKKANRFNRVFERGGERVRGLWGRNGLFHAQIRVSGRKVRLRLEHAETVPQGIEAMQVLKNRDACTFPAPAREASEAEDLRTRVAWSMPIILHHPQDVKRESVQFKLTALDLL